MDLPEEEAAQRKQRTLFSVPGGFGVCGQPRLKRQLGCPTAVDIRHAVRRVRQGAYPRSPLCSTCSLPSGKYTL